MPNSILGLLSASKYPLSVEDIARVLRVDDATAAKALQLYRKAGRARLEHNGRWTIS